MPEDSLSLETSKENEQSAQGKDQKESAEIGKPYKNQGEGVLP